MTTVTKSKYQPLTQMRLKGHPVSQQLSAVLPEPQSNPAVKCFTELVQKPVILQWELFCALVEYHEWDKNQTPQ